jgi:hypothetical protein
MRSFALRAIEFLSPTHLAEALVGDLEESKAGGLAMLGCAAHLLRPHLPRICGAALAAWLPLEAIASLMRFVQSQVPLKTGPGIPWTYLAAALAVSAGLSLAILKKERRS